MGRIKMNILRMYDLCLTPTNPLWNKAKDLAEKISASELERPASSITLLKADCYSVTGIIYNITFRVEGDDGVSVDYTAKVCSNICGLPHILYALDKVPGSERKPKDSEIDDGNTSEKKMSTKIMGKQGLDIFKGLISAVPMTTTSEFKCRKDYGKLRTRAFYVLVEQIRRQRSWNYARVKKCASTIWQNLPASVQKTIIQSFVPGTTSEA